MRRHVFLLLAATLSPILHAQSTKDDLSAHLLHQSFYLRGLWRADTLYFDSSGHPLRPSETLPFTLAGIDIDKVQLKPDRLLLDGQRIGLMFRGVGARRITLPQNPIHIEIARPPDGDYAVPLDAVLTEKVSDLLTNAPSFWDSYVNEHLVSSAKKPNKTTDAPVDAVEKIGGSITPARVLRAPGPKMNDYVYGSKLSGTSTIHLVVDTSGKPTQLSILHPLGLGLDECAITAVQQYKFAPATRDGHPVAVEMAVEVNFDFH